MIHNTHAHATSVASTTMMGPKTAATIMVATDIPPDCSASSVVVAVSVGTCTCGDSAKNVTLEVKFMNGVKAYWHIQYNRKFLPGEYFGLFHHLLLLAKILSTNF